MLHDTLASRGNYASRAADRTHEHRHRDWPT